LSELKEIYTEEAESSSSEAPNALLKMALWFAERDVRVVPCGPDKKALSRDWRSIATKDPEKVREYFDGTDSLLAIVPADNEMVVLNVPYNKIGENWITELPSTRITSPPGGGRHIYFGTPKNFGPAASYRGVRVISDGYVIVPPSPGWEIVDDCDMAPMPRGMESTLRGHSIPCRTLGEFLTHKFPPVKAMLGQWLLERGSSMLCGRAGLGKTWSSLGIAIALAARTQFLDWKVKGGPRRVLYIDGEMPAEKMQERYSTMLSALTPAQCELAL
jgi:hypothetical protein